MKICHKLKTDIVQASHKAESIMVCIREDPAWKFFSPTDNHSALFTAKQNLSAAIQQHALLRRAMSVVGTPNICLYNYYFL
jgi:hypothetical protein